MTFAATPDALKPIAPYVGQLVDYLPREPVVEEAEGLQRQWFVLLCHPQHEKIAAAHLVGRRFKTYLPTIPDVTTRGIRRRKVPVQKPMFPGYLFLRFSFVLDEHRRGHVEAVPGVHKFLQIDDDFAVVPDAVMARVREVEENEGKPRRKVSPWSVGQEVRINEGPFCGINAQIIALDAHERIRVLLSFLGRAVKVLLPVNEIEKL